MRISDWSSDVCSSDLRRLTGQNRAFNVAFRTIMTAAGRIPKHRFSHHHDSPRCPLSLMSAARGTPPTRASSFSHQASLSGTTAHSSMHVLHLSQIGEHPSELQSLMSSQYGVCFFKKKQT